MKLLVCLLALVGVACVSTTDAQAWRTMGPRWPHKVITYHVASPSLDAAATRAASAWNTSASGVRWQRVRRGANVTIRVKRGLPVPGRAHVLGTRSRIYSAEIQIAPWAPDLARTPAERRFVQTLALVHEMGHAMGLDHDTRYCATMEPVYRVGAPLHCRRPPEVWRFRCRLLEPDDLTGARHLFGGHGRGLTRGPEFCDLVPAPPSAEGMTVAARPGGGAEISWTTPADGGVEGVRVLRSKTCPVGPEDPSAAEVTAVAAQPGTRQTVVDGHTMSGGACYAVVTIGAFQRPGAEITAVLPPGPPPGPSPVPAGV